MKNTTEWTDEQLDLALAALHSEVDTDDRDLSHTKELLRSQPPARSTQHRVRVLAAAAASVAVVAGLVAVQAIPFRGADQSATSGPYYYQKQHSWRIMPGRNPQDFAQCAFRYEAITESWTPADPTKPMLWRNTGTGKYSWIVGPAGDRPGCVQPPGPRGDEGTRPQPEVAGWEYPTAEFVAALPRDPQQLYDRLRAHFKGYPDMVDEVVDVVMFTDAAFVLASGFAPADLRAALRQALLKIPGVRTADDVANVDGRAGTAYVFDDVGTIRHEFIVDPPTSELIGMREIQLTDAEIPAGTMVYDIAVTTGQVDTAPEVHPSPSPTPSR